jgi:hypothetical protein
VKAEFAFALEYVDDIDAARRFHEGVAGLTPQRTHPQFVQYEGFAIASDEALGGTRGRELYWTVANAESAFAEVSQTAEVVQAPRDLPFGKVFALRGPAGEPVFFLEWAVRRPSAEA